MGKILENVNQWVDVDQNCVVSFNLNKGLLNKEQLFIGHTETVPTPTPAF